MTVSITTETLSTRVRYLNVSGSTANDDAKDVVLAMADALIALGWTRYDTAGSTSVIGTDANAGVILRRACHDNAQSDNFNYLGLRLVGSNTSTYTFYIIQAADWTSTTSMTAFVNAATTTRYTPNTTGNTRFLNFDQGGTIWMFDSGKTLLLTSQSGDNLVKDLDSIWVIGEYKKEFGENVNAATGYIHNGVFTNNRWMLDGCGVPSNQQNENLLHVMTSTGVTGTASLRYGFFNTNAAAGTTTSFTSGSRNVRLCQGAGHNQFSLTQAPALTTTTQNSLTLSRAVGAPTAGGIGFLTRLLMGYMGYIGHINSTHTTSINAEFLGSNVQNSNYLNGTPITVFKLLEVSLGNNSTSVSTNNTNVNGFARLFQTRGNNSYSLLENIAEFSPTTLPTNLKFTVFEPTLSCGSSNGVQSVSLPVANTYTGPQYKFSMLGRIFDMKIFGPFTDQKYILLDSITIPCNADGFYQEDATDKDFWIIPSGENMAFLMPK